MGVISLVLGILAILAALVPVFGPLIATPAIIIGSSLSARTLRAGKGSQRDKRLLRTGLALCIIAIPVMVINTVARW